MVEEQRRALPRGFSRGMPLLGQSSESKNKSLPQVLHVASILFLQKNLFILPEVEENVYIHVFMRNHISFYLVNVFQV